MVLVHRIDFEGFWWPQNEGKIDPKTKIWNVYANFGQEQDNNFEFEIAVIVVSEKEHQVLKNYREKAMTTGNWKPMKVPPTACAPKIRKVRRADN